MKRSLTRISSTVCFLWCFDNYIHVVCWQHLFRSQSGLQCTISWKTPSLEFDDDFDDDDLGQPGGVNSNRTTTITVNNTATAFSATQPAPAAQVETGTNATNVSTNPNHPPIPPLTH